MKFNLETPEVRKVRLATSRDEKAFKINPETLEVKQIGLDTMMDQEALKLNLEANKQDSTY